MLFPKNRCWRLL